MIQITEPVIEQVIKGRIKHLGKWKATFNMWDDARSSDIVIETELGAPTEERLQEKIKHLKETGIILRG